jgi:hypothetical protein
MIAELDEFIESTKQLAAEVLQMEEHKHLVFSDDTWNITFNGIDSDQLSHADVNNLMVFLTNINEVYSKVKIVITRLVKIGHFYKDGEVVPLLTTEETDAILDLQQYKTSANSKSRMMLAAVNEKLACAVT